MVVNKKITFVINDRGLLVNKELHPKPIKDYIPEWYKSMQIGKSKHTSLFKLLDKSNNNIKSCPSFNEIYQDGFVILAPNDYILAYDKDTEAWSWQTPISHNRGEYNTNYPDVDMHNNDEMINHIPTNEYKTVFKINLPIKVVTPKGYSVRVLPIPYSFNNDYEAVYGILRADKFHEMNIQILYKTNKKEILIKKGSPLCVYAPFKREKFTAEVVDGRKNNKLINRVLVNQYNGYAEFGKRQKHINYYK